MVYFTRRLHKLNYYAVSKYSLRDLEATMFQDNKPVKQGDKTDWNQVPRAIRKLIIEDYKSFYPSYDN
jgi:hypothetical protein